MTFSKELFLADANFCRFSNLLVTMYRFNWIRPIIYHIVLNAEGGEFFSGTLREILFRYHGVCVGEYSYGSCMLPGSWPAGVSVGRYTSVGNNVKIFLRNHPMERLSMHPFFYNKALGYLDSDNIPSGSLKIEHDVWIGANVIFTSGCSRVGIGSVVGTGSVVTKDVPDFAVVAGNPARFLRFRFIQQIQEKIIESKWWEKSIEDCVGFMDAMVTALDENHLQHPLLKKVSCGSKENGEIG